MASIPHRLLLQSRQCPTRIRCRVSSAQIPQWQRPLSTSTRRCAADDAKKGSAKAAGVPAPAEVIGTTAPAAKKTEVKTSKPSKDLSPADRDARILSTLTSELAALDPDTIADAIRKGKQGIRFAQDDDLKTDADFAIEEDDPRKVKEGFWAEGEEELGQDPDYYGDDLTSLGHGELQKHRELREYARLIAWELPLLSHLAQPFTPPTPSTPYRFRYTSYLGESHPAANKVVVEFSPPDLPLTAPQRSKLIKLAGPRYNPSTEIIKLSCETHDTQSQNKRFLADTIAALLDEAKTGDKFEDVPFDFRHHKAKKFHEFPAAWAMTGERRAALEEKRRVAAKVQDDRRERGELVDGKGVIETSLPFRSAEEVAAPVPVFARR